MYRLLLSDTMICYSMYHMTSLELLHQMSSSGYFMQPKILQETDYQSPKTEKVQNHHICPMYRLRSHSMLTWSPETKTQFLMFVVCV